MMLSKLRENRSIAYGFVGVLLVLGSIWGVHTMWAQWMDRAHVTIYSQFRQLHASHTRNVSEWLVGVQDGLRSEGISFDVAWNQEGTKFTIRMVSAFFPGELIDTYLGHQIQYIRFKSWPEVGEWHTVIEGSAI